MLLKNKDLKTEKRMKVRDGDGYVKLLNILDKENFPNKVDMFSVVTLDEGCSIGPHVHDEDVEVYFGLVGEGDIDDNGTISSFKPGDVNICGSGDYHAIKNTGKEPLKFVVLIVMN